MLKIQLLGPQTHQGLVDLPHLQKGGLYALQLRSGLGKQSCGLWSQQ